MKNKEILNVGAVVLGVVGAVVLIVMMALCFKTEALNFSEVCSECIATFSMDLFFSRIQLYIMISFAILILGMMIFVKKNSKYLWSIGLSFANICMALNLSNFFKTDHGIVVNDDMSLEFQNAMINMEMGFFKGISMSNIVVDVYLLFICVIAFILINRKYKN